MSETLTENIIARSAYKNRADLTEFVIPEGVTEICSSAFQGCTSLETIVIPGSVKKIGSWGFCGCRALKKVVLEEGVEWICASAFADCSSLHTIVFPESLKRIDGNVFYRCVALRKLEIPKGVDPIEQDIFGFRLESFMNAGRMFVPHVVLEKQKPTAKLAFSLFYLTCRDDHDAEDREMYDEFIGTHKLEVLKTVISCSNELALKTAAEAGFMDDELMDELIKYASDTQMPVMVSMLMAIKEEKKESKDPGSETWANADAGDICSCADTGSASGFSNLDDDEWDL